MYGRAVDIRGMKFVVEKMKEGIAATKQKTRKMSIRWKILIPTTVMVLGICLVLGVLAYVSLSRGMISAGIEKAQIVA